MDRERARRQRRLVCETRHNTRRGHESFSRTSDIGMLTARRTTAQHHERERARRTISRRNRGSPSAEMMGTQLFGLQMNTRIASDDPAHHNAQRTSAKQAHAQRTHERSQPNLLDRCTPQTTRTCSSGPAPTRESEAHSASTMSRHARRIGARPEAEAVTQQPASKRLSPWSGWT